VGVARSRYVPPQPLSTTCTDMKEPMHWGPSTMPLHVVTFKAQDELIDTIDELASRLGITRSELIRRALDLFIKHYEHKLRPQPRVVVLNS